MGNFKVISPPRLRFEIWIFYSLLSIRHIGFILKKRDEKITINLNGGHRRDNCQMGVKNTNISGVVITI